MINLPPTPAIAAADPFHVPPPVLAFALVKAECDQAFQRAMARASIAEPDRLALMVAFSRELDVSALNPAAREAINPL